MADIKLDEAETALWNEVGSRGDAFRRSVDERVEEQLRITGRLTDVLDEARTIVEAVEPASPAPPTEPPLEPAG